MEVRCIKHQGEIGICIDDAGFRNNYIPNSVRLANVGKCFVVSLDDVIAFHRRRGRDELADSYADIKEQFEAMQN